MYALGGLGEERLPDLEREHPEARSLVRRDAREELELWERRKPGQRRQPADTEGGDPVAGSLGSFTWGDGGSDSPWLPGASITVGAGESLTVRLPDDAPVQDWVAKRVAAGTLDGAGAISLANGAAAPITFRAPAPGAWSVQVDVTFGDDLGSAAYYWAVTVR